MAQNTISHKRRVENLYPSPPGDTSMLTTPPATPTELAVALLNHYSFDLSGYSASELINRWQTQYPVNWLHLAVVEALYQGRYKAISVQQILTFWQRRGQAIYHFNMEFERLICSKFPESLTQLTTPVLPPLKQQIKNESASIQQPVTPNPLLSQVGNNDYKPTQTATIQPINQEKEKPVEGFSTTTPATQSRLNTQNSIPTNSPLQKPDQQTKILPPSTNHPPIGQFTPAISNRVDSFTSKLKAISDDKG